MLNLTMTRLRTASWALTVVQDIPPVPVDLTGKVLWFFAKLNIADIDTDAIVRKNSSGVSGIVITDIPGGLATLTLSPSDTARVALQTSVSLFCSLVLVDGASVYELDTGTLTIAGNVDFPR